MFKSILENKINKNNSQDQHDNLRILNKLYENNTLITIINDLDSEEKIDREFLNNL